uniref:Uncharacterized protein n=1 Tax=Arundo donax TaxID=35708 RepID=A0A0A9F151_ARUDO
MFVFVIDRLGLKESGLESVDQVMKMCLSWSRVVVFLFFDFIRSSC